MNNNYKIQAEGDFPFTFYIEKAIPSDEDGEMIITGVASTCNVDHDNERMSPGSLVSMAEVINEKSVPLRIEHQKEDNAICGKVFKAWVDERNNLWVKAILDKNHPASGILYKSLKDGVKLGLSVGGRVKKALREMVESQGKMIKTFYQVALDEVSVTQRPANYDAWLIAKSWRKEGDDMSHFKDSPLYNDFLFDNPQLDYMSSFAKSIPQKEWKNLQDINKNIMPIFKQNQKEETSELPEEKKKSVEETTSETTKAVEETTSETTKAEETETETTKGYASKEEVTALKSMVAKGFESIMGILAKTSDTTTETETTKAVEETTSETTKAVEETTSETTKAVEETTSETTKATETEDETTKSINSSISRLNAITKAMEHDASETTETETTKAEETETDTTKSMGIDDLALAVTKAIDAMSQKLTAQGRSIPGFTKSVINELRNDPEFQEEISKSMKQPGLKKSVSMGVPFVTTKEGHRFALTLAGNDTVEKSQTEGKTFKEVFKSQYSSVKE